MKYHKITFKETGKTKEAKTFKSACMLSGVNYQSALNKRHLKGVKDFENKQVKIEQLIMIK